MDRVVVTGFGPFGQFPVNASWEVAKGLKTLDFESNGVELAVEEIPVVYDIVEETVPKLWEKFQPKLMVHIGVSAYATELTLETCARRDGYEKPDVNGQVPENNSSHRVGAELIKTSFDIQKVSLQYNLLSSQVQTIVSIDAGRYLCEFIYYTSLSIDSKQTVFIHVPDLNKPYSAAQMSAAVRDIIILLLDQLRRNDDSNSAKPVQ